MMLVKKNEAGTSITLLGKKMREVEGFVVNELFSK